MPEARWACRPQRRSSASSQRRGAVERETGGSLDGHVEDLAGVPAEVSLENDDLILRRASAQALLRGLGKALAKDLLSRPDERVVLPAYHRIDDRKEIMVPLLFHRFGKLPG